MFQSKEIPSADIPIFSIGGSINTNMKMPPADVPVFSIGGRNKSKYIEEYGNPTSSDYRVLNHPKLKSVFLSNKYINLVNLSTYGYSLKKNDDVRHDALKLAMGKNDLPPIYLELYLLASDSNQKTKKIINRDISYMKQLYKKSKNHQKGGIDDSDTCDTEFELIDLPEKKITITIYEKHKLANREIIFYTLGPTDINQIHKLDIAYLDSDQTMAETEKKIKDNPDLLIGIKSDTILQGYCQYKPTETINTVKIVWFCANKSYGTPLYKFIEKYFLMNGYHEIILTVSLIDTYAIRRLNFWNKMEFQSYEINNETNSIYMRKIIN